MCFPTSNEFIIKPLNFLTKKTALKKIRNSDSSFQRPQIKSNFIFLTTVITSACCITYHNGIIKLNLFCTFMCNTRRADCHLSDVIFDSSHEDDEKIRLTPTMLRNFILRSELLRISHLWWPRNCLRIWAFFLKLSILEYVLIF